jgi:Arc/MetJ family transcription regulator
MMRTNIVIDDDLMDAAMKAGQFKTKRDAVEEGLRLVARRAAYQTIRAARGKLHWSLEGDWTAPEEGAKRSAREPRTAYRPKPVRGARK